MCREVLRDGSSPGPAQGLRGFSQPGHLLQRPPQRHAGRGCLQCHGAAHLAPPTGQHGHGHTDEAVHKLLGVRGIALPQDLLQLGFQGGAVGQSGGRVAGEGRPSRMAARRADDRWARNSLPLAEQWMGTRVPGRSSMRSGKADSTRSR